MATDTAGFQIKSATESDVHVILSFVRQLAHYERLSHEVVATEALLRETLFGERRTAEVAIDTRHRAHHFVLFFHTIPRFETRSLHRDLVDEHYRGRGYGRRCCSM
jgi:GNAT superfamily N-acetyltransferase